MIRLSKPQILLLHEQLIAETGGSSGLRDEGMLDSELDTRTSGLKSRSPRDGFFHATGHHILHEFWHDILCTEKS